MVYTQERVLVFFPGDNGVHDIRFFFFCVDNIVGKMNIEKLKSWDATHDLISSSGMAVRRRPSPSTAPLEDSAMRRRRESVTIGAAAPKS